MTNTLTRRGAHPFTGMIESFFDDPLFAPALRNWRGAREGGDAWTPAVDLAQTDDGYLVTADLPGMTKEDINLTVENNTLILSGERKFERKEEGPRYDRIERSYGKFSRTFYLPSSVDVAKVKASFKDGVLTVEIPKAEQAKSRQIEIA